MPTTGRRIAARIAVPIIGLAQLGLTGCAGPDTAASSITETPKAAQQTDPRQGWVDVWEDGGWPEGVDSRLVTRKRCDATSLVYRTRDGYSGGVSVVPNSPECR